MVLVLLFASQLLLHHDILTIEPAAGEAVSLPLRFETAGEGSGTVEIRSRSGAKWSIEATAQELGTVRTLSLPAGDYDLAVHLQHHRSAHASLRVDAAHPDAPKVIRLAAAPLVRGAVVRANGAPLARARVTLAPTGEQVSTGEDGRFAFEVTDRWPDEAIVASPGYGTLRLPVPAAEATVELPRVTLGRAARIRVKTGRAIPGAKVELTQPREDSGELRVLAVRRFAKDAREVVFDDVARGSYVVVVRGEQPLQVIGAKVGVAAGDERVLDLRVPIRFARIKVLRGDAPYADARVVLESIASGWSSTFSTGAAGEIDTEVWESGWYEVGVSDDANSAPFIGRLIVDEQPALPVSTLAIGVPDRRVRGRVLDRAGAPVANATVTLRSLDAEQVPTVRARTNENGVFVYSAVQEGRQLLQVSMPGFLRPDPLPFELRKDERLRELDLRLERGAARAVEVADTRGAPASGALVICADGLAIRSVAYTDPQGRADVATPPDRASKLYVLPNEGSLAIRALKPDADGDVVLIAVPAATSSLELTTLTTDGTALPDIGLVMRYNGELIPPAVASEMHRYQGFELGTDANGTATFRSIPPGTYEFWPYRTQDEVASIMAAAFEAPINVDVVTGPNKATVRFRKRP